MSIDPKQVAEAQRIQRESEKCKHPTHEIRDLPDRSYCKACGEDVAPLKWDTTPKPCIKCKLPFVGMDSGQIVCGVCLRKSGIASNEKSDPIPMDWMGRTKSSVFHRQCSDSHVMDSATDRCIWCGISGTELLARATKPSVFPVFPSAGE